MQNRLFLAQTVMDEWLAAGRGSLEGEVLTLLPEAEKFQLRTAVLFCSEVTGAGDGPKLIGKVKDLEQIHSLGGDYSSGTVLVGDLAYEVVEGFAGLPIDTGRRRDVGSEISGESIVSVLGAAAGDTPDKRELDLLAKLFLSSGKKS